MKIILQRLKYRILAHTMTWLIASQLQREYWFAAVALQLCRFYSFRRLRRLCQLCRILFFSPIIDFFSFCKSFIVFFFIARTTFYSTFSFSQFTYVFLLCPLFPWISISPSVPLFPFFTPFLSFHITCTYICTYIVYPYVSSG